MSLKGFHVLFIALSCLLSLGLALWCFASEAAQGRGAETQAMGGIALAAFAALVVYGIYFLRKLAVLRAVERRKPEIRN